MLGLLAVVGTAITHIEKIRNFVAPLLNNSPSASATPVDLPFDADYFYPQGESHLSAEKCFKIADTFPSGHDANGSVVESQGGASIYAAVGVRSGSWFPAFLLSASLDTGPVFTPLGFGSGGILGPQDQMQASEISEFRVLKASSDLQEYPLKDFSNLEKSGHRPLRAGRVLLNGGMNHWRNLYITRTKGSGDDRHSPGCWIEGEANVSSLVYRDVPKVFSRPIEDSYILCIDKPK